ncbi:MAG: hypothetical protein ACLPGW_04455 [Roseiarcus sp.]
MEQPPNSERVKLIETMFKSFRAYAPGWSVGRVAGRVYEIEVFFISNSDAAIPLSQRRRIERTAKKLREELKGLSGLHGEFRNTLRALTGEGIARSKSAKKLREELEGLGGLHGEFRDTLRALAGAGITRSKPKGIRSQHGGDRRSREHTLNGSVLRMLIHLYMDAHAKPGFSTRGPVVRFVNAGGELVLGKSEPFNSEAVRAEWQRMRKVAPKRPSLRALYRSDS